MDMQSHYGHLLSILSRMKLMMLASPLVAICLISYVTWLVLADNSIETTGLQWYGQDVSGVNFESYIRGLHVSQPQGWELLCSQLLSVEQDNDSFVRNIGTALGAGSVEIITGATVVPLQTPRVSDLRHAVSVMRRVCREGR
jgi:hypothetical protein